MHPMLNIAVRAARSAGRVITRNSERIDALRIERKAGAELVSEVDRQAEAEIIGVLQKAYPDHGILGEESGQLGDEKAEYQWIIDPLDGTTNFLHGLPHYCVSIALLQRGRPYQGVIYDPVRQELFTASYGEGATLEGKRLRIGGKRRLEDALISTALTAREGDDPMAWLRMLGRLNQSTGAVRRTGSAALDLAWVAAGRLDASWALGLKPWDCAAGGLMVREAGGLVNDLGGGDNWMHSGDVLASAPRLQGDLLKLLRAAAARQTG